MKNVYRFLMFSLFFVQLSASSEREGKEKPDEKTVLQQIAEVDAKLNDVYSQIIDLNCIPHSSQAVVVEEELAKLYIKRKNLEDQREALTSNEEKTYDDAF